MQELSSKKDELNFFETYFSSSQSRKDKILNFKEKREFTTRIIDTSSNLINGTDAVDIAGFKATSLDDIEKLSTNKAHNNIIFLTNNTLARIVANSILIEHFKQLSTSSLVVCHDFDNHHWYEMSNLCQEFADFYFPSHPSGLGWIQNFPSNMRTFIPAGTVQWPRKLIHEFQSNSILDKRSDEPLGKHHFYPKFTFRNRVIHTFSDLYPDVCFVDSQIFHTLTPEDKLSEWAAHKVHLIIPVRGDIPNRFFDALITGGLPVVPRELEIVLDFFHIPRNFYSSYNLEDLITPKIIIDKALEKFDSEGKEGILERSYFCLNNFHVLINLHKMLKILLSDIHDTCN